MTSPSRFPHHRLDAFHVGVDLVTQVHTLIPSFARGGGAERDQLRRSAPAIVRNLVEGASRRTPADKLHSYTVARAECAETNATLQLAAACGFADAERVASLRGLTQRLGAMLTGLIRSQERRLE